MRYNILKYTSAVLAGWMLQYLEDTSAPNAATRIPQTANGNFLGYGSTFDEFSFGFEIASTGGSNENFKGLGLTAAAVRP